MRAKSWKKIQVKTSSHNLDPPEGGSRIPLAAQLRDVEENVLQKDEQAAPRGPEGPCPPAHFLVRVSPEGTWGVTAPPPCTCSSPGVPAGLSLSLPAPFPLSPCHPVLREGLGGRASSQAEGKKWRFQARRTGERRRAAAGNRQGARGAGARGERRGAWLREWTQANRAGPTWMLKKPAEPNGTRTSGDELLQGTGLLSHGRCKAQ